MTSDQRASTAEIVARELARRRGFLFAKEAMLLDVSIKKDVSHEISAPVIDDREDVKVGELDISSEVKQPPLQRLLDSDKAAPLSHREQDSLLSVICSAKPQSRIAQHPVESGRLISSLSRFCVSVALKHDTSGWSQAMVLESFNGLALAIERFTIGRDCRLSTYGYHWIRQAVSRSSAECRSSLHVPVHRFERVRKVLASRHALWDELGRPPTPAEIAERMELSPGEVERIILDVARPMPLNFVTGCANWIIEKLWDPTQEVASLGMAIYDHSDRSWSMKTVEDWLTTAILDPNTVRPIQHERKLERLLHVVRARLGLGVNKRSSLQDIAENWKLSRERIRQIETKAIRLLRKRHVHDRLREFLVWAEPWKQMP